jgi:hypothetical protein
MHAPRLLVALLALPLVAACGDDGTTETTTETTTESGGDAVAEPVIDPGDGGDYQPDIEAADFVDRIDNPYLPFLPGARWVYEGESEGELERIEVEVLDERREVFGVDAVVVQDQVFVDGELVEDTRDWYAQDREGNVWYLGEETAEYEDGEVVSTEGSWEAGVDGALPGIVMPADPQPGDVYRQEFYEGEAEDMAEVLRTDDQATVPAGTFDDVVTTREWTPLEPDVVEEKHYARGVGVIFENKVTGDGERVDLIEFTPGG